MNIPPAKIYFPEKDRKKIMIELRGILKFGNLTLGVKGEEFENRFKEYNHNKYAISTSSGASALEIILRCLNIKDSSVIIPTNTSVDTALAVIHAGGRVVFSDCDETICLDPNLINEKLTKDTKAVIIVHIGGIIHPKVRELQKICKDNNVFLIEDAAHAHGSTLNNKKAGSFSEAASFSFYPTKVITSAEGGMIVTNNENIDKKARILRDRGKPEFHSGESVALGSSWRMSEVHAIIGLSQLNRLEEFIRERRKTAKIYNKGLNKISGIKPLKIADDVKSNYYKYIALLDKGVNRVKIKEELKKMNVNLSGEVYQIPCHLQPVFKNLGYKLGDFPVAEDLCNRHICLPIFPTMKKEEIDYVLDSINKVLGEKL